MYVCMYAYVMYSYIPCCKILDPLCLFYFLFLFYFLSFIDFILFYFILYLFIFYLSTIQTEKKEGKKERKKSFLCVYMFVWFCFVLLEQVLITNIIVRTLISIYTTVLYEYMCTCVHVCMLDGSAIFLFFVVVAVFLLLFCCKHCISCCCCCCCYFFFFFLFI